MSNIEQQITKLYRENLRRELDRPEIQSEKRQFLQQHFPLEAPAPAGFSPFAIPAFAMMVVFFAVLLLNRPLPQQARIQPDHELDIAGPMLNQPAGSVQVQRVTSHVGSTMVYQKMHHDVPITIVWVFPGG